jgi:hypothetical protein
MKMDWGEVVISRGEEARSIQLKFSMDALFNQLLAEGAGSEQSVEHRLDTRPPSLLFYYAVDPTEKVSFTVARAVLSDAEPRRAPALIGFRQATDTSMLLPVYSPRVSQLPLHGFQLVAHEGYEWFRGYRLARLRVTPYELRGDGYLPYREVEITVKGGTSRTLQSRSNITASSNDPFDLITRKLILNPEELAHLPRASFEWYDSTGNWWKEHQDYIKLSIPQDRIYRLTRDDFQNTGSIDPRTFRLFHRGKELPLYVHGEEDGLFSEGDYIEFPALRNYGHLNPRLLYHDEEEYPEFLNRYTDTSYYWLTWGSERGLRISPNDSALQSHDTLRWYTHFEHIEQNSFLQFIGARLDYHQDPRWLRGDMWGWGWLGANGNFNVNFNVTHLSTAFPFARVWSRFASWGAQNVFPAHVVCMRVNNSDSLAGIAMAPYEHAVLNASVPITALRSGTNTIQVSSMPTASSVNWILFDWAEAEYPRNLVATNDSLLFAFLDIEKPGLRTIRIDGCTSRDIVIYKYQPTFKRIAHYSVSGTGPYSVTFVDSVSRGDHYMLFSTERVARPQMVKKKRFANLRSNERGADYLLITHPAFLTESGSYASFIQSTYQLRTAVISVEDVFDEFGFGYPTPESIREFIRATTRWQAPMPSYLFLVGDATYDYKFVMVDPAMRNRPMNFVPSYGHPVSDVWYAVLGDSSLIPQLLVGRLAVNSPDELRRYRERHRLYLSITKDDWNKRFLFFAGGDPKTPGQVESFRSANERIIQNLIVPRPIGGKATSFYKTASPQSDFGPYTKEEINEALDAGAIFINYIGHSGTQTWDNGIGAPAQLQNTRGRFALITDFGCSTAKFAEPTIRAFGELFTLDPDGSAIAYIGNSSLGFVSNALLLPEHFSRQFLSEGVREIGAAHLLGKLSRWNQTGGGFSYINRSMMLCNLLLGDAVVRLALPEKPDLRLRAEGIRTIPATINEDDEHFVLNVPFENVGLAPSDSFVVQIQKQYSATKQEWVESRLLPTFADTLRIRFPSHRMPGTHRIEINLNSDRRMSEEEFDRNKIQTEVHVVSRSLKILSPRPGYAQDVREIAFLNPTNVPEGDGQSIELQIDTTETFSSPKVFTKELGMVVTKIPIGQTRPQALYYWRARLVPRGGEWVSGSFLSTSTPTPRWIQSSPEERGMNVARDLAYEEGKGYVLAAKRMHVQVTSSGFDDGGFGAVEIDRHNVLPNTFAVGHSVVVLDSTELKVKGVRQYDTWNSAAQAESLRLFLNGVKEGDLVVQLIIDEGSQNVRGNAARINAIKSIGSALIDSVRFRDSWAIIGRKGAKSGTVPEGWRKRFSGRVRIDTTLSRIAREGEIASPGIGPAGRWHDAKLEIGGGAGEVQMSLLGIRRNGGVDTLVFKKPTSTLDLSSVSSELYPHIRLIAHIKRSEDTNPVLRSWSVGLESPAELAINSQTVSVSKDSVLEGETIHVLGQVLNTGGQVAEQVKLLVIAMNEVRGEVVLDSLIIPRFAPDEVFRFESRFETTGMRGLNQLAIRVDPDDRIVEMYESNNFFTLPVRVSVDRESPTFELTFDGERILDGDLVSARPEIVVRVFDASPLPIADPALIDVILDGRRINIGSEPDSLFVRGTGTEKAKVIVRPSLASGLHSLALRVRDASGNELDTARTRISFRVDRASRLLNVFNFPNPFSETTHFTFQLGGEKRPDELIIRIYTVAGRLLRELRVSGSELRFGLNKVWWDGRDAEGSEIANGTYLYTTTLKVDGEAVVQRQKLVKLR